MSNILFQLFIILIRIYAYLLGKFGMILPFPEVEVIRGEGASADLVKRFCSQKIKKVMILTDRQIESLGLHLPLFSLLKQNSIDCSIFSEIKPDPNFEQVNAGIRACQNESIDAVIAIGGGSVMDAAKIINQAARYNRNPRRLMGLFRVLRKAYTFACIPTTAGTGSEVTVAALITDEAKKTKRLCLSPFILPDYAVLDSSLLKTLPPSITAASGMDAFTHAFESYMSVVSSEKTKSQSLTAMKLIYENLKKSFHNSDDLVARENMLYAAHLAGLAFTRANVGWVHAIAHQLGGMYHVNHGLANAIILPKIMSFYQDDFSSEYKKISTYLQVCSEGTEAGEAAKILIEEVQKLNDCLNIPRKVVELKKEDIDTIAKRAFYEVCSVPYPVPKYFLDISTLSGFIAGEIQGKNYSV